MSPELDRYPRPGVTVDLAVLTLTEPTDSPVLRVLVQERRDPDGPALPGGFVRERQTVAETTRWVLADKVGVRLPETVHPRLLRLFDDPTRDDRTWAISAAHALSLPSSAMADVSGELVAVRPDGTLDEDRPLLFDHDEIVAAAVADLRYRYDFRARGYDVLPDPDGLLPQPFTLLQLRRAHEAVIGGALHKDNFAKRMRPHLREVTHRGRPALSREGPGRPATLFRIKKPHLTARL